MSGAAAKVVVTGADGFIGTCLGRLLARHGFEIRRAVRRGASLDSRTVVTGDLSSFDRWEQLVDGADAVVHLAARAHVLKDAGAAQAFRPINRDATVALATAAAGCGVRRFVFVSSIGVNGDETFGRPFTETDAPCPQSPYAVSKWEAEQALWELQQSHAMQVVVVRPPLIYGPAAKGNFERLLKLVGSGVPLPLGGLRAPRSFIGLDNLCDLLLSCLEHPAAAGELFLAAEPETRSTAELLEAMAAALGRRHQIWRWPPAVLQMLAAMAGKTAELRKLSAELQVDASKAIRVLGWQPKVAFTAGVAEAVRR